MNLDRRSEPAFLFKRQTYLSENYQLSRAGRRQIFRFDYAEISAKNFTPQTIVSARAK